MDVEKNEAVIVLDRGQDLEEVAIAAYCCRGKPSAAAANVTI